MRVRTLVGVMGASLLTVVLSYQTDNFIQPVVPTETQIIAQLPNEVQVLLPGGLCDSIHAAFLLEVERFPMTPTANRRAVLERIEYYRDWLRRKGCG